MQPALQTTAWACVTAGIITATFNPAQAQWIWPLGDGTITDFRVNSTFGPRLVPDSDTGELRYDFHRGIDSRGVNQNGESIFRNPVYAVADGEVVMAGKKNESDDDITVILKHMIHDEATNSDRIVYTRYTHLYEHSVPGFNANDPSATPIEVIQGQQIGKVGRGSATFPHLHFEIREDENKDELAVHPMKYLPYPNKDNAPPKPTLSIAWDGSVSPAVPQAIRLEVTLPFEESDLVAAGVSLGQPGQAVDFDNPGGVHGHVYHMHEWNKRFLKEESDDPESNDLDPMDNPHLNNVTVSAQRSQAYEEKHGDGKYGVALTFNTLTVPDPDASPWELTYWLEDASSHRQAFSTTLIGQLTVAIAGSETAGESYDQLVVSGDTALAGRLTIELADGFTPSYGDTFDVLTYDGTRDGVFDQVVGAMLSPQLALGRFYEDNTGVLRLLATAPGDANGDLIVDLTDFGLLVGNFNQPGSWEQGDFDGNGVTNISDFGLLAANFNGDFNTLATAADDLGITIPQPGTVWVCVPLATLVASRRGLNARSDYPPPHNRGCVPSSPVRTNTPDRPYGRSRDKTTRLQNASRKHHATHAVPGSSRLDGCRVQAHPCPGCMKGRASSGPAALHGPEKRSPDNHPNTFAVCGCQGLRVHTTRP